MLNSEFPVTTKELEYDELMGVRWAPSLFVTDNFLSEYNMLDWLEKFVEIFYIQLYEVFCKIGI